MDNSLQKVLKKALLNNSFDYESMQNSINKTWKNSFSYLYTLQNSYIEYEELFYFSNDTESRNSKHIGHLFLDRLINACFDVDYDLIGIYNREPFRKSKFYLNEFTIDDMIYNPLIFTKIPVVIIDDKVIWDYKIRVTKDCTRFKLPFHRNFVLKDERDPITDDIIYIDHKVQVLVVDNIFYQRFKINKYNLNFNSDNKSIKINNTDINKWTSQNVSAFTSKELMNKWGITSILNMTLQQSVQREKLCRKRLQQLAIPNKDGIMMCSIHFPNIQNKDYQLGTALIPMVKTDDGYIAELTDDIVKKINEHSNDIYISIWFMNRLYHHRFYDDSYTTEVTDTRGANLLVVQRTESLPYEMPIPVEDFMVFKKKADTDGFILEKNTEMLELHYPNIYKIKDQNSSSGDVYDVYYFYHTACDLKYTVIFDFYFTFLRDIFDNESLEKIINDVYYNTADLSEYSADEKQIFFDIFTKIFNYQYFHHNYGETDFLNRYMLIPGNEKKQPIEYKIETLSDWITVDSEVLRDYVLDQNKLGASYHLFTNTIDLNSRLRDSTELEFDRPTRLFSEPRYVFAFNNEKDYPLLLNCRVFVDGLMVGDIYQERKLFMDYFYIPVDMVTEDSYIEIEIFPEYEFEKEMTFTGVTDRHTLTLAEPSDVIFPTFSDFYFKTKDGTERYTSKDFDVTTHYSRGDFVVKEYYQEPGIRGDSVVAKDTNGDDVEFGDMIFKNLDDPSIEYTNKKSLFFGLFNQADYTDTTDNAPVKFTRLSTFSIAPTNEEVLNTPLIFTITKMPRNVRFMMSRDGYAYIEIIEKGFNFSPDYLRIYRNGRLMPRIKYRFLSEYQFPRLLFLEKFNRGDIIYIDITPYRYNEIYYQEELSKDTTLIDLKSIINKPFDIRYYDVYINGRKLSLNNVFSISPWEITLVNLKSNYNLLIYEKERDWEYFGLDYKNNIYYYTISDLFKSSIVTEDVKNKMIKDIIDSQKDPRLNIYPNTNDEEKLDFSADDMLNAIFNIYYYDRLIPNTYMNPDVLQENENVMKDGFKEIYEKYICVPSEQETDESEKNRKMEYPKVLCFDPDIHCSSFEDTYNEYEVYSIGHPDDDIDDNILKQHIEIPDNGNINIS